MKNTILFCSMLLLATISAQASTKTLVKSCTAILSMPGENKATETQINVFQNSKKLSSTITQKIDGTAHSRDDVASLTEEQVQAGLIGNLDDIDNLNLAERLIVHAMTLTEDPIYEGIFKVNFNLKQVRSAKVYIIGEPTHMGLSAIVEAKDASGKVLGSFLGGFFVNACI